MLQASVTMENPATKQKIVDTVRQIQTFRTQGEKSAAKEAGEKGETGKDHASKVLLRQQMDEAGLLAGAYEIVKRQDSKLKQMFQTQSTRNGN